MRTDYQIYDQHRHIVATIRAHSHEHAARVYFETGSEHTCEVGRKGTAAERHFARQQVLANPNWPEIE